MIEEKILPKYLDAMNSSHIDMTALHAPYTNTLTVMKSMCASCDPIHRKVIEYNAMVISNMFLL